MWSRFEDQIAFHRKILAAGNEAVGAWARMICWSTGALTDGAIPQEVADLIVGQGRGEVLGRLVAAGLLEETNPEANAKQGASGLLRFRVHDFADYQPSARAYKALCRDRAKAGKLGGVRSGEVRRDGRLRSKREANAQAKAKPIPNPILGEEDTPSGRSRSHRAKGNGKVPEGYQDAMAHWCTETKRLKGTEAHVNGEEGRHLKSILARHPTKDTKAMMTAIFRSRLPFVREGHRFTLRTLDTAWTEIWSEAKARAAAEGESWP